MKRTNQQGSPSLNGTLRKLLIPIMIMMALLVTLPAAAQQNTAAQATLSAPGEALTVGDPIALTLTVTHPADQHVIAPELDRNWGDFVIQGISAPESIENPDGSVTTSLTIDARLFAPGAFSTQPLTVKVADNAGQIVEVMAPPAVVEIGSVLVEGDTALRDIKPQADLPYVNLLPWIIIGLSLAGAVAIVILAIRRSRALRALAAIDNRLPHEVALDELERIEGLRLPDQSRFKEHYSLIADTVRLYMERQIGVPMMERTTAEIEAGLRGTSLPRPIAAQTITLLDASDLVKFAKFKPDTASAYDILQSARQIVLSTKPVDETEPATKALSGSTPSTGTTMSKNGSYQQTEVRA